MNQKIKKIEMQNVQVKDCYSKEYLFVESVGGYTFDVDGT
jgi:hypothetical protein